VKVFAQILVEKCVKKWQKTAKKCPYFLIFCAKKFFCAQNLEF